jgi:hypothetical protein
MRTVGSRNFFLPLAFGLAAMALSAAAVSQTTFNGPAGTTAIFPTSIDAGGDVAGYYFDSDGSHGFILYASASSVTPFSLYACDGCASSLDVWAINSSAMIVGDGYFPAGSDSSKAFVCAAPCTTVTEIDPTISGVVSAPAINDSGVVTGSAGAERSPSRAFGYVRSAAGVITKFQAPNPSTTVTTQVTQPTAINSAGAIAGSYLDSSGAYHVFKRAATRKITSYDIPATVTNLVVTGINSKDEIVGHYYDGANNHGFIIAEVKKQLTITTFDYPGATGTAPSFVNSAGTIVGYYYVGSGPLQAFQLDSKHNFTNLNIAGATTTVAMGINDNGFVTGYYVDSTGNFHGFIL